jgi:uncharacterized protein involved in outer membrane biogenesis
VQALRVILGVLLALIVLAVGTLWIGPGVLDWNRYRGTIATLATAALGRPVRIDGAVTLELLPQPILTASQITVVDASEGAALHAKQLRLVVGLGPLLFGHVNARELVLGQPELRLDWPLAPAGLPPRPAWLSRLAARIEDGTLIIGGVTIRGIDASISTDADTGALAAAGSATLFDLPWRFTGRISRRDPDGATRLEATLDGMGPVRDTGGRFSGALGADGSLQGQISGRGPDLSRILPAPAVPWRAAGRLTAAGGLAAADELSLDIAGSPARGAVALRVSPQPRLDLALTASRLDLDSWLPVLLRGRTGGLETGIDLSAEAATLQGGTLRALRGSFDLGPDGVAVRDASAVLPGDAVLRVAGVLSGASGGKHFSGAATANLPDLRSTLAWLQSAKLLGAGVLPPDVLRSGELTAQIAADARSVTLSDVSGTVDGTTIEGDLAASFGAHPLVAVKLQMDRLLLDPWLPVLPPPLPEFSRFAPGYDLDLHLQAKRASLHGMTADGLGLDVAAKSGRLTSARLAAAVQGVQLLLSGQISDSGRVVDGLIKLSAADAEPLAELLPPEWNVPATALRGPFSATVQASGPPNELALNLEADLADAQLLARPVINLQARSLIGPVALRHPGAPRLLELLGINGTAAWLGDGSLSILSQVSATPDAISADHFELTAGSLRATGQLAVAIGAAGGSAGPVSVHGRLTADTLPLPLPYVRSPTPLPFQLLHGWSADIRLEAGQVLAAGVPVLDKLATRIELADGQLKLEGLTARLDDGALAGDASLDTAAGPPTLTLHASLTGATVRQPALDFPWDITSGALDATCDVHAAGFAPAAMLSTLSGGGRLDAHDGRLSGLDLAAVTAPLRSTAAVPEATAEATVREALTHGSTSFTRFEIPFTAAHGAVNVVGAQMIAASGQADFSGSIDLTAPSADLTASITPAVPSPPQLRVRLSGALDAPSAIPELADLTRWIATDRAAAASPAGPSP